MTTGCCCSTPGCPGPAHDPGGRCQDCQIAAMPSTAARLVKQILHAVLDGRQLRGDHPAVNRYRDREAG
jgi:hypothetical protein